ncbi:uncharacterized protein brk [Anabrus simplex]|uniref:uncharacterized protein brk n=1 Tax=Anabrus simplex TaxID=316456 RepID=UPI0035A27D8F
MAQGLGREVKEQTQGKECSDKKASVKSVRCSDGKVMGSRRIFAPQFKLQVLDSYRKDEDCKGNQRATARKYGIHRRQIQKWLQVEASLRTSVEVSPASEPTALNLSADAARQRDDSGESRQAACQRGGEQPSSCNEHTDTELLVKLEVADHEDLHLKEEQVYEDNMEVHNTDEALDFTCAALSKRRSFSLQFKLEVLDAFHADRMCHGNQRATARKFGINRRQVQKWLGQEAELRGEAAFRGGLYRQRLGRWMDLDENKKAEENVPTAHHVESDDSGIRDSDQCWDLSGKKRRLEVETIDTVYSKRRAVDQTVLQSRGEIMNENYDVSSSVNAARDVLYSDVQETALCLVKGKSEERPEVTSSIDTRITYEPQIVPPSYHPHMVPLVLPAPSYDLYSGLHCRHHYMHHLQPPKWFTREPELCQDFGSFRAFNMFR